MRARIVAVEFALVLALLPGAAVSQDVTIVGAYNDDDEPKTLVDHVFVDLSDALTKICQTNAMREGVSVDATIKELRDQGDIAELVNKLVASGDICAVRGHQWMPSLIVISGSRPYGSVPEQRECLVCGKVETKQPGEWK